MINLPPDLLAELAAEHANVVAVKQANNDDLGPIEGLEILAGNDDVFLRTLEFGGAGGILVASQRRSAADARALRRGDRRRRASAPREIDAELGAALRGDDRRATGRSRRRRRSSCSA